MKKEIPKPRKPSFEALVENMKPVVLAKTRFEGQQARFRFLTFGIFAISGLAPSSYMGRINHSLSIWDRLASYQLSNHVLIEVIVRIEIGQSEISVEMVLFDSFSWIDVRSEEEKRKLFFDDVPFKFKGTVDL